MKAPVLRRDIVLGEEIDLFSPRLGETRRIRVRVPRGYSSGANRYPVLYLLDGDETYFLAAAGTVAGVSELEARVPEMLIVAVDNTDRLKDMTPTAARRADGVLQGGGADAFLEFLGHELVPWVDATWRTLPCRILAGTSASALPVVYAALRDDTPFTGFIASSPCLFWGDSFLLQRLEARQTEGRSLAGFLFLYCGEHDQGRTLADCQAFAEQALRPDPRAMLFRVYAGEGHCPRAGLRDGLLELFDGWAPPSSIIQQGASAVRTYLARPTARLGTAFSASTALLCAIAEELISERSAAEAVALLRDAAHVPGAAEDIVVYFALALESAGQSDEARRFAAHGRELFPHNGELSSLAARLAPPGAAAA